MTHVVRKLVEFQSDEIEPIKQLAAANFPKPSGVGNISALIRSVVHMATMDPERFGLAAPGQRLADLPTIEAEVVAQTAGQPPLDVSTLQENQPDWQSPPSDAGLPETVKALSKG